MRDIAIAYLAAAIVMLVLDIAWLNLAMGPLYQRFLGPLLAEDINMKAALAFYLLYLAGVVYFAVIPAVDSGSWSTGLLRGAVLGLIAYGTYDLTNMATLKGWSLQLSALDMTWGTLLTGASAGASAWITLALQRQA